MSALRSVEHRHAVGAKYQRGPLHESFGLNPPLPVDVQAKLDRVVFALKEAE
jgi:hypothetical protein